MGEEIKSVQSALESELMENEQGAPQEKEGEKKEEQGSGEGGKDKKEEEIKENQKDFNKQKSGEKKVDSEAKLEKKGSEGDKKEDKQTPKEGDTKKEEQQKKGDGEKTPKKEEKKDEEEEKVEVNEEILKNGNYIYLNSKIQLFELILDYLEENFADEREGDIENHMKTIDEMKATLKLMVKENKTITKGQIDKKFPNPKKEFILGFTEDSKKKEYNIIQELTKRELTNIQSLKPKVQTVAKQYYAALKQKIDALMKDPNQKLPKMNVVHKEFSMKEINNDIPDGSIGIRIIKLKVPKTRRFFCVNVDVIYND